MIDRTTFASWMGVLADRTNRTLAQPTLLAYYAALSPQMTTDEFERAAAIVFRDAKFWPEPAAFLAAARPAATTGQLAAGLAWDGLSRCWVSGHGRDGSYDVQRIEAELGVAALAAFRAMGGGERLIGADRDARDFARRDFVAAYDDAARLEAATPGALPRLRAPSALAGIVRDVMAALPSMDRAPKRLAATTTHGDD